MYILDIRPELDKKFSRLNKKNKKQYEMIMKKVEEILKNPQHYKNLRVPLQNWKRIHIDKHFVLAFSVNENTKVVTLEDFDHHNTIYTH